MIKDASVLENDEKIHYHLSEFYRLNHTAVVKDMKQRANRIYVCVCVI